MQPLPLNWREWPPGAKLALLDRLRSMPSGLGAREPFDAYLRAVTPRWLWDVPHLAYMRRYLQRAVDGECDRLMFFAPPRHGKSEQNTVRFAAWLLESDPTQHLLLGAYNQTLAERFSRKIRRLVTQRGRVAVSEDRKAAGEWDLAAGGGFRAAGVGSGITGIGADWILLDDVVKSREEAESIVYRDRCWNWWRDDVRTRLEPQGRVVLTMARWHADDLAGRLLAAQPERWTVVKLPARAEENDPLGRAIGDPLWPERYDTDALDELFAELGDSAFGLYQGRPTPASGSIFRREWFRYVDAAPEPPVRLLTVQSWDCGTKARNIHDPSVCGTWAVTKQDVCKIARWKERVEYPELEAAAIALAAEHAPDAILIEDKGNGSALIQCLRRRRLPVIAIEPHGDKVMRASVTSPLYESGRVAHVRGAAWLADSEQELLQFPRGAHDDDVDQTTQFLSWIKPRLGVPTTPHASAVGAPRPAVGKRVAIRQAPEWRMY